MIDAIKDRALMNKTPNATYALLKELASNNYQWTSKRAKLKQVAGMLELDQMSGIAT